MSSKRIFVTGANGFIGKKLVKVLCDKGYEVVPGVRENSVAHGGMKEYAQLAEPFLYPTIDAETDWSGAFDGVYAVVHLAARVHITAEYEKNPLHEYRRINTFGTEKLALEAARQGVKRFVFLSSIGVNGSSTHGKPFQENDKPSPHNDYSSSKLEAELLLETISSKSSMTFSIIRPPLVYGPGVKANFLSLLKLVSSHYPLPFGGVKNKRSFISLSNLIDFIHLLLEHPDASGLFLVKDNEDISTSDLMRCLREGLGVKGRLLALPYPILYFMARIVGRHQQLEKMCGSLQIDMNKAERVLGWKPQQDIRDGLHDTAQWFKESWSE